MEKARLKKEGSPRTGASPPQHSIRLPFFPVLREGELLYSGIARLHYLLGELHCGHTLQVAIGKRQLKPRTAGAPSYITALATRLPIHYPYRDPEALLNQHTVIPMLTYFLDAHSRAAVRESFLSDRSSSISLSMLGHSRHRHMDLHKSLTFCPTCVVRDAEQFGTPHWHVEHQLPAVFVCPVHGDPLVIGCKRCGLTANSIYRAALPSLACIRKGHQPILTSRPEGVPDHEIVLVARELSELCKHPAGTAHDNWTEVSKAILLKMGFTRYSQLDRVKIYEHLRSRFSEALLRWIGCINDNRFDKHGWINMLFNWRKRRSVLDCLLFTLGFHESIAAFEEAVKKVEPSDISVFQDRGWWAWYASQGTDREKYHHQACSLTRAARTIDRALGDILRGEIKGPPNYQRKQDLRKRALDYIVSATNDGIPVAAIAKKLGVRKADIRKCLDELEPRVSSEARHRNLIRTRDVNRAIVSDYLSRNPHATRADVWGSLKSRCRWLLKIDAAWFDAKFPRRAAPSVHRSPVTANEDDSFSRKLRAAANTLRGRHSLPRVSINALLSEAAATTREREHVIKMPKSAAVIAEQVETREDWWKRRIRIYIAIAGAIDCRISSNRIKREHHLIKGPPEWAHEFIRDETIRQGFTWVSRRSGWLRVPRD